MAVESGEVIGRAGYPFPCRSVIGGDLDLWFDEIGCLQHSVGTWTGRVWAEPTAVEEGCETERHVGDLLRPQTGPEHPNETHTLAAVAPAAVIIHRGAEVVMIEVVGDAAMEKQGAEVGLQD